VGQESQFLGEVVLPEEGLNSLQIHPRTDYAIPKLLSDPTLVSNPVPKSFQNGRRGFIASLSQYLNELPVVRVEPVGVRSVTSNLVKPSLDFSSLSLHSISLSARPSGIPFSVFLNGMDMIDQTKVIFIVKDDVPISKFSKDSCPEFDTLLQALKRENVLYLFQGKRLLRQAGKEERLTHQQ
jgi:hypothetical protein